MKCIEDIEIATKLATGKEIMGNLHSYRSFPHSSNNSIWVTCTFGRWTRNGDHLIQMAADFESFMNSLYEVAQVKKTKVAYWGYLLANPVPHIHVVAYSTRDRQTGNSLARMSGEQIRLLEGLWKGMGYDSVCIRRLYDHEGLIDYLGNRDNLLRPKQRWSRLEGHNLELLQEKSLRKAA